MFDEKNVRTFQNKILSWYKTHKRVLPWRETTNPYHIFISEVMLQQTQVRRVIPYYEDFLKRFPDFPTLAKARKRTVLSYWSGLGYNSRALRLRESAHIIVKEFQGEVPADRETLLELPGIGRYTSASLLSFIYNIEAPVVDTNIRRVLIYKMKLPEKSERELLEEAAMRLIPRGKSREWNSALIDYGAVYATAKKTRIESLSKQSKFEGSERQIRGAVLKYLLKHSAADETYLSRQYPHRNFKVIINKMADEGLIKRDSNGLLRA